MNDAPISLSRFDAAVRDADRAALSHRVLRRVLGLAAALILVASVALTETVAGMIAGILVAVGLILLRRRAVGFDTAARRRRSVAVDIAETTPEVLSHTTVRSPYLAEALNPALSLTRADVLAYQARVASSRARPGNFFDAVDVMLTRHRRDNHETRVKACREYFDGEIDALPVVDAEHDALAYAELAQEEIDEVGAEFMAALTGPENRIAGDLLADTTKEEVAALYDALAAAHDPEVDHVVAARDLTLAWRAVGTPVS